MVASRVPPTGDLGHNPGMCPHWESNQQHLASQSGAQSSEPHQPGHWLIILTEHVYGQDIMLFHSSHNPYRVPTCFMITNGDLEDQKC